VTDQDSEEPIAQQVTDPGAAPASRDAAPASTAAAPTRGRRWFVNGVILFASILGVVGMLAVFANRLLFNPDNFASTSTQMLQNPAIRSAVSNYLVDQLYANVDVAGTIKSALPPQLKSLAGPAAGAVRSSAPQAVNVLLTRPAVQSLWEKATRAADQTFIAIVKGGNNAVGANNGTVTLNLGSVLKDAASRLGISSSIFSKLPPSAANLTILKSKQLSLIQDLGNGIRGLALALTIVVPLLYAAAVALARGRRRRTLMSVGFALSLVGLLGLGARVLLVTQVPDSLIKDVSIRPAGRAVVDIVTQILGDIAAAFVIVGVVFVLAALFAGPARAAVRSRRFIAPFVRDHPGWTYGIVASVMLVIFIWQPIHATGTAAGIIVFSVLAALGTDVLRHQIDREFPAVTDGTAPAG
jgi:hypothetical protein